MNGISSVMSLPLSMLFVAMLASDEGALLDACSFSVKFVKPKI